MVRGYFSGCVAKYYFGAIKITVGTQKAHVNAVARKCSRIPAVKMMNNEKWMMTISKALLYLLLFLPLCVNAYQINEAIAIALNHDVDRKLREIGTAFGDYADSEIEKMKATPGYQADMRNHEIRKELIALTTKVIKTREELALSSSISNEQCLRVKKNYLNTTFADFKSALILYKEDNSKQQYTHSALVMAMQNDGLELINLISVCADDGLRL